MGRTAMDEAARTARVAVSQHSVLVAITQKLALDIHDISDLNEWGQIFHVNLVTQTRQLHRMTLLMPSVCRKASVGLTFLPKPPQPI